MHLRLCSRPKLHHLACQCQNLTPPLLSQLCAHHPIDPGPQRLFTLIQQDARIVIESHCPPIAQLSCRLLLCSHDDGTADVALAYFGRSRGRLCALCDWSGLLDHNDDFVTFFFVL